MTVVVNGKPRDVGEGTTLTTLLAGMEIPERGVAVAVDAEVVPRGQWDATVIEDGANVEVVTAIQGG